jgi:hypothetical protein
MHTENFLMTKSYCMVLLLTDPAALLIWYGGFKGA